MQRCGAMKLKRAMPLGPKGCEVLEWSQNGVGEARTELLSDFVDGGTWRPAERLSASQEREVR